MSSIFVSLSTLAVRQLVTGVGAAVGLKQEAQAVVGFLSERFTDHSQRLTKALESANESAWKALEIALAGDTLWERCKVAVARSEDKAFARQVRTFLDAASLPERAGDDQLRQKCLEQLRAARKARKLAATDLNPRQLAKQSAEFARFSDPESLLDAEWQLLTGVGVELREAGYPDLGWLVSQRPLGTPILLAGVRYFFRRSVEEDQQLFQGLAFAKLEALSDAQEEGFTALAAVIGAQGQTLEALLEDVKNVVVQTHNAVLDLRGQMQGHGEQIQQIGQAVQKLLEQHQLTKREVRTGDSLSIRNEGERQLVRQLVDRYRAVPEAERHLLPALLNAIGKLEVVTGDFEAAQRDFQQVAILAQDNSSKAEAHFNAYRAALERRDLKSAMKEFIEAVRLDAKRFAPFPVGKYQPKRILGAGGFGVAFLCRHKYMNADVVVKTLQTEALGREADTVFTEAQALRQLDHPAIIRISECGYVDAAAKARPHIIMDYFQGQTLEEYVKEHGPVPVGDLLAVARQAAEGLEAAHGAKILHRDVKPANMLVRKEQTGWKVKIIDFGLAMTLEVIRTSQKASTLRQQQTMLGSSIAGTLDYGSPEQMGRRTESVGPYSDVYGWAKTCCYALFQTTQPLMKHWQSVPPSLAKVLEDCLAENPAERPASFTHVLKRLDKIAPTGEGNPDGSSPTDFSLMTDTTPTFGKLKILPPTGRKANKSNRLPLFIAGGLTAIAAVAIAVILSSGKKANPPQPEKETAQPPLTTQPKKDDLAWKKTSASPKAEDGRESIQFNPSDMEELSPAQIETKYRGKIVSLTGVVRALKRDDEPTSERFNSEYYGGPIEYRRPNGSDGVTFSRLYFNEDIPSLRPVVQQGKSATVSVHGDFMAVFPDKIGGGIFMLKDCKLTQAASTSNATESTPSKDEQQWVRLFNGKDLTGWTGFTRGFQVDGGELVMVNEKPSERGDIYTEAEFSDFVLRFDFQLPFDANSGITVRHKEDEKQNIKINLVGKDFKLVDKQGNPRDTDSKANQVGVIVPSGYQSLYVYPNPSPAIAPPGSWNQMEITVKGANLKVIVNGVQVVNDSFDRYATTEADKNAWKRRKTGKIGFGNFTGTVRFRDIMLRAN